MKYKQIIILQIVIGLFGVSNINGQSNKERKNYYVEVKENISFPVGFDKAKAEEIISNTALEKAEYFENGRLVNDEFLQKYVNQIAARLSFNDKSLSDKAKVYVIRNLSANAISFLDGSIFINQGLFLNITNEAELAFIIAHELAHIKKQHALKEITRDKEVIKQEINVENKVGRMYRYLSHSKENEYEADGFALNTIIQANYDPSKAIHALSTLDDTLFFQMPLSVILFNMLSNDISVFDSLPLKKKLKTNKNNYVTNDVDFLEDNPDDFSTHPDVDKRILSLIEQIKIYEKSLSAQVNQIKTQDDFDMLKKNINTELINSAIDQFEYHTAFYFCLKQLESAQQIENNAIALKCLYFIALAKQNNYDEQMLSKTSIIKSTDIIQLNNMFLKYNTDKFKNLIYGYASNLYEKNKQNEDIHFYYALVNELYLGKQTSKIIFQNLQNKFPSGKYSSFIKTKLN